MRDDLDPARGILGAAVLAAAIWVAVSLLLVLLT
jgi:hypothetical protein